MKLTQRLEEGKKKGDTNVGPAPGASGQATAALKTRLHTAVIDKLDTRSITDPDPKRVRDRVRSTVEASVAADHEGSRLSLDQRALLVEGILDEIAGLGPLEGLLHDPTISDILVNNAQEVFIERQGKLELTEVQFSNNAHLVNIIQRIVSRVGRRVDESSPMVDARLPDGSRVNAVMPPIAPDGAILSIRRFGQRLLDPNTLISRGVCTPVMMRYLNAAVQAKCNLLVSGGTGAGKTTLLNVLSGFIPANERVITIEDSVELSLQGHHVVRMEARPANIEGKGEVTIRACVRNALRMRPDRVVIGEIRGGEVLDMLQAMNTGHEGSMATVHSNSPVETIDRLIMMLALSGVALTNESMSRFVASSLRVIVQVGRFPDGSRRMTHIAEVSEYDGAAVPVRSIFTYDIVQQRFVFHGPSLLESRFAEFGIKMNWSGANS